MESVELVLLRVRRSHVIAVAAVRSGLAYLHSHVARFSSCSVDFSFVHARVSLLSASFRRRRSNLSKEERTFVIFPIIAFILWSLLSAAWAPSWKSAMHHSLVWIEYLIFFFIARHLLDEGYNGRKLLRYSLSRSFYTLCLRSSNTCAFLLFGGGSTLGMRYAKFGEQVITILPLAMVAVLRLTRRQFQIGLRRSRRCGWLTSAVSDA